MSKCLRAPGISDDTEMTVVDESTITNYKCNDKKYLNFSSLKYPNDVNATCSKNKIFQNKLPFWTIDEKLLPLEKSPICVGNAECSLPPSEISEMIHTWNGSMNVGSSFQYSCHRDGERALTKFLTHNSDNNAQTALEADTRFFLFRSD